MGEITIGPADAGPPAPAVAAARRHARGGRARWSLGYQPGLDGLRAVAMAWMFLYHAEVSWAQGAFLSLSQFFTLSGFLVATVLLAELDRSGEVDVRRFLARRVRRLWPASLATLAGIAMFGATVADASQQEALPRQVTAAAVHLTNWLFIADDTSYVDQFAAPSPVQHFWSLSVEEQFYLCLPLLLLAAVRFRWRRRTLAVLVGSLVAVGAVWTTHLSTSGAGVDRVYYGTDTRMAEILVGVLFAVVMSRAGAARASAGWRRLAWGGAVAYAVSLVLFATVPITTPLAWRGGMVVFAGLSCLVIGGVLSGTGPLRVLSWGPLAAMGRLTYGLYLFHLPVYLWLTSSRTGLSQWPLLALRLAVTFALAVASHRLVEKPFRAGALSTGRLRVLLGPGLAVVVVAATFATAGGGAPDPWATLREGRTPPPVPVPDDPVLDVLVVTDRVGRPIAERLRRIGERDETVEVAAVLPFDCDGIEGRSPDRGCRSWREAWPGRVEAHDPDVVFLFVDDWAAADLERLAGASGTPPEPLAAELMADGIDLLTARGATVVWGTNPEGILEGGARGRLPFHRAMDSLLLERSDLRRSAYLPPVPDDPDTTYLREVGDTVLEGLWASRRIADTGVPRVLVVGDSQARAIGYGLERLESDTGGAVVWNVAAPGCGIADDGTVRDVISGDEHPVLPECRDAVDSWARNVEDFQPDLVLVLSSLRDVQDRRLDGAEEFETVGDRTIDRYLVEEYTATVDALSAGGATVVWMKPPCLRYVSPLGGGGEAPPAFDPARIEHLNEVVLPELQARRPARVVLYGLEEVLCPGGEFLESTDEVDDVRPDGIHPSEEAALWLAGLVHRDLVVPYG